MAEKKKIMMRIAGNDYMVSGTETEEHLRMIESCVNEKIKELHKLFSVQGMDEQNIIMLAAINLADDCIKVEKQLQQMQAKADKLSKKEKQLQETVDRYEEELMNLEIENQEYAEKLRALQQNQEKEK